mmetsp:Transcript_21753/g.53266  ORF Transcript_21753/g.53266 Transcript_21753/m.53266 type:complete len:504 (-) Transcript_21753:304-1815(-)
MQAPLCLLLAFAGVSISGIYGEKLSRFQAGELSIEDFGAVAGDDGKWKENINAILIGFQKASEQKRVLVVPSGKTYSMMGLRLDGIQDVKFRIDGTLKGVPDFDNWPLQPGSTTSYLGMLEIINSRNVTITSSSRGRGLLNGQGYTWWWSNILQVQTKKRPELLYWKNCSQLLIENIKLKNSPRFNLNLDDVSDVIVRYIDIETDLDAQRKLQKMVKGRTQSLKDLLALDQPRPELAGFESTINWKKWLEMALEDLNIPTFPLNTDGMDVKGRNIHIHDCSIVNFDDIIVPKPCNSHCEQTDCTENILIENIEARGVGMSIGSVPPSLYHNCVNNITFRNVSMESPLKGIYIKTDPGDEGTGMISNVTFENFHINRPLWWAIWIGPQQQHQPGWNWTEHQECALNWPLGKKSKSHCMTNKNVAIKDILLKDVLIDSPLLSPGVILCNETRFDNATAPSCSRLAFQNVTVTGLSTNFPFGRHYFCQNVEQSHATKSDPAPNCFD